MLVKLSILCESGETMDFSMNKDAKMLECLNFVAEKLGLPCIYGFSGNYNDKPFYCEDTPRSLGITKEAEIVIYMRNPVTCFCHTKASSVVADNSLPCRKTLNNRKKLDGKIISLKFVSNDDAIILRKNYNTSMGDWLKEYIEKKGGLCSKKLKLTCDYFEIFGQDDTPSTLGLSNGDKIQVQLIIHCICHGSLPSCYFD